MVTGENLDDLGYCNDFFRYNTKDMIYERNNNKLDFIKTKNFCSVKDSVKELEEKAQTRKKYSQKTHQINVIQNNTKSY